jgi:hypothetical protein
MLAGLQPSVGSVGDAIDNALCETTVGLYKTERIRDGSPFRTGPLRTLTDLEDITSAWVHWVQHEQTDPSARASSTGGQPKPSTTLTNRSDSTPITRNEMCIKPGMLQPRRRCISMSGMSRTSGRGSVSDSGW